jgi:hypothetical protein
MSKKMLFAILASLLIFAGCDNDNDDSSDTGSPDQPTVTPEPNPEPNRALATGKWGADDIGLTIERSGADVMLVCGEGRMRGRIRPNENGRFRNEGTIEQFGAIPEEDTPNDNDDRSVDAVYEGFVNANKTLMSLTVTWEDPETNEEQSETYTLRKGENGPDALCARPEPET